MEGETDCIRQHARGSRCFTGRTNRDMSVIKPDAGDIKHRPFGTHLWRKPEGQEFGSATVGRARACSDAVMAMHSAPTTISTPVSEDATRTGQRFEYALTRWSARSSRDISSRA